RGRGDEGYRNVSELLPTGRLLGMTIDGVAVVAPRPRSQDLSSSQARSRLFDRGPPILDPLDLRVRVILKREGVLLARIAGARRAMRKRERENPCDVCGHYHKYEEGEVCGVCGHRVPAAFERPIQPASAFPSEILTDFLYLGSYDNASRGEILKTLRITHILNVRPPLIRKIWYSVVVIDGLERSHVLVGREQDVRDIFCVLGFLSRVFREEPAELTGLQYRIIPLGTYWSNRRLVRLVQFGILVSYVSVMVDFDHRCPLLGGINLTAAREKEEERERGRTLGRCCPLTARRRLGFFFATFFAKGQRPLQPSSLLDAVDEESLGTPLPSNGEATTSLIRSSPRLRQ
ncbi:hypothetical protein B296_00023297, partial [Ensete ventricosum]